MNTLYIRSNIGERVLVIKYDKILTDNDISILATHGINIGTNVKLGDGVSLISKTGDVSIDDDVILGEGCMINSSMINRRAKIGSFSCVTSSNIGSDAELGGKISVENFSMGGSSCMVNATDADRYTQLFSSKYPLNLVSVKNASVSPWEDVVLLREMCTIGTANTPCNKGLVYDIDKCDYIVCGEISDVCSMLEKSVSFSNGYRAYKVKYRIPSMTSLYRSIKSSIEGAFKWVGLIKI